MAVGEIRRSSGAEPLKANRANLERSDAGNNRVLLGVDWDADWLGLVLLAGRAHLLLRGQPNFFSVFVRRHPAGSIEGLLPERDPGLKQVNLFRLRYHLHQCQIGHFPSLPGPLLLAGPALFHWHPRPLPGSHSSQQLLQVAVYLQGDLSLRFG